MRTAWVNAAARVARRASGPLRAATQEVKRAQRARSVKVRAALARPVWRAFKAQAAGRPLAVQLGCGVKRRDGWFNIDVDGKPDLFWDLRDGLPFVEDGVVDLIYHEHFLEHLGRGDALALLRDCHRTMTRHAVMRVAVPDLADVLAAYAAGKSDEQGAFDVEARAQYGETLLRSRGELLDLSLRAWGHRYLYDEADLVALLGRAGFAPVRRVAYRESEHPMFVGAETRPREESSLVVEAVRS